MTNFNVRIFTGSLGSLVAYFDSPLKSYEGRFEMEVKYLTKTTPTISHCEENFICTLDQVKDKNLLEQIKEAVEAFKWNS